jgi:xanthosine utilization system XapX-like protein
VDSSSWLNIGIPVLIGLAVASRGFRVDADYVARWANSAGVELTDASRPVVRRYLAWSRRSRTAGGLTGFLAPLFYARVTTGESDPGSWSLTLMLVGYLLGAIFAEIVVSRSRRRLGTELAGGQRLNDYLPTYVLVLQRGLALLIGLLVVAYALLEPHTQLSVPPPTLIATFGLAGICLAALVEGMQRRIIARRNPVTSPSDPPVEDALKSSSVHVLAGAGVALLLNVVGPLVLALLALTGNVGPGVGFGLIFILFPLSIFFWLDLGKPQGFRVRRRGQDGVLEQGAGQ